MRVLITGASGGIGAACVQRFLDEGHEVVGFDLLPAAIKHERYRHLIVDVREPDSFPGDLEPQVIVNVAGTQDSADDIAANLCGTINVTERYAFVGEGLAARPAPAIKSVVNVGSASGHTGSEFPAYAASKGGVIAYTKNLANRLAPQAIANSVDPGGVITPLNRCVMEDEHLWNQIMELTPLKRGHRPRDRRVDLLCGRDQPVYDRAESANRWRRGRPHTIYLARIGNAPDGKLSGAFLMYRLLAEASPVDGGRVVLFE